VWQRLQSYTIGPADAALTFAQRLARENGWTEAFTARVLEEYKRFCVLAVTGTEQVTPSDQVDQVWHLHLTYTRDYWERFCPEVLGKPLHHGPTAGGESEQGRFFEQYACTLRRYEQVFGPPPSDIWPDARRRLYDDPRARRVHPRDGIVLPHPQGWLKAILIAIAIAATWIFMRSEF
jgi:hypothetical protein